MSVICPGLLSLLLIPSGSAPQSAARPVAEAVAERRARVEELRVIRRAAEELGIRVWLFGGTAAGFAHYVRADLAREAGDSRYRDTFFDYDFTNIYRSTQDADLVMDGTPDQAERLEALIRNKMSFLQGSKEHWEVRLLRQDRIAPGGQVKQALLANPDFLGQHTDSNSTGMIELTDPPPGETVVRDLRDWESAEPFFLKDVAEGRLHYYWSPTHRKTSRYLHGDNPELFSVIRYLVKAFQYDLQVEGEDLERVKAIIDAFEPQKDYASLSPWAQGWLERYGPNLVRHAVNIEYAWDTLERLGLRRKLIALSETSREGSLAWWLDREPLRTLPLGSGPGRTAAELGIEVVAHETDQFLSYESITRDTTLRPNVLISRPGHPGESAALGPGFYARMGRVGARGSGLTIRFRVDPQAREGTDFRVHGDVVLFTNRAALRVIPESLDITLLGYFEMLRDGPLDHNDRGAWMKLKRRLSIKPVSREDEEKVVSMVSEAVERENGWERGPGSFLRPLLKEWFTLPLATRHPELMERLLEKPFNEAQLICTVLAQPQWAAYPDFARRFIGRSLTVDEHLLSCLFAERGWTAHPELVLELLRDGQLSGQILPESQRVGGRETGVQAARRILGGPLWEDHPEVLAAFEAFLARAREHRFTSPEALGQAYAEAADTVVVARLDGTHDFRETVLNQRRGKGGTYSYRGETYRERDQRGPGIYSDPKWCRTRVTGLYAKLLVAQMAGLPPQEQESLLHQIQSAAHYAFRDDDIPALHRELEAEARRLLRADWPAVDALAGALLREDSSVSRAELQRILALGPGGGAAAQAGQAINDPAFAQEVVRFLEGEGQEPCGDSLGGRAP